MDLNTEEAPSKQIMQEHIKIDVRNEAIGGVQQEENDKINKIYDQIMKYFSQLLKDLNSHPKMNNYLQEINVTSQQFVTSFKKIILVHEELQKTIIHSKAIRYEVNRYYQFILDILNNKMIEGLDNKGRLVWYLELQIKLSCCDIFLSKMTSEKNITNTPREEYKRVWDRITFHKAEDVQKTKSQFKSLKKMMHIAASAQINESKHEFSLIKKMVFGCSFPKYLIMNDQAKLDSFKFYRNPTIEMAQMLWNLPENGGIRELSKINYEGIKTNVKIYLPVNGLIGQQTNIFEQTENTITVRILCDKKLNFFNERGSTCCSSGSKEESFYETIIIHMHGGGFIALSSRSMQAYTRKWANKLHVPVLSIDYRMPPSHPFPQAPQDCFLVYNFVVEHIHKFMNIRPKSIYLAGDSAGGNLACSLAGMVLKNKLPGLKGIYAIYPAVDTRLEYSYSKLYSFTDPLLWPANLLLCLKSYLGDDVQKANNPLASPILYDQEFVNGKVGDKRFPSNWPKTMITVGNRDPLYDSSLMFMERLVQSNIECECIVYEQISHGFMNLAPVVSECERALNDSIRHLRKLMQMPQPIK